MRLDFPATSRNREPILAELRSQLPPRGTLLEIASGSGQHAAFMAPRLPDWLWQPSDPNPRHRQSIRAWTENLPNVRAPLDLDVLGTWPSQERYQAVLAINLLHVSPWEATPALMRGAFQLLEPGGLLYLYGAMKREGRHTAPSNEAFDRSLRAQDPAWRVRDCGEVVRAAEQAGLAFHRLTPMPSNNLSLWLRAPSPADRPAGPSSR